MREFKFQGVLISILAAVVLLSKTMLWGQGIPPITDLTGTVGPEAGQVTLAWSTPLFENPVAGQPFACSYEFRSSIVYIDDSNWDDAGPVAGNIPPIAFAGLIDVELELDVQADSGPSNGYYNVFYDKGYLRARLVVWLEPYHALPVGHGIPNETINFKIYDSNWTLVDSGSGVTDRAGKTDYTTIDLTNDPNPKMFHFAAFWQGHNITVAQGLVISAPNKEEWEDHKLWEGASTYPKGNWSSAGGVYQDYMDEESYEFLVPAGALELEEQEVTLLPLSTVPDPNSMNPGVPGAMVGFQLEIDGDPNLLKPILISVTYPAEKLDQYGGLGESSLRGYRYDDVEERWVLLEELPVSIDRDEHCISFRTDRLGSFALAAETDSDSDGMGDYEELRYGTNPSLTDTDGDGISDGDEIWFTGGDPHDGRKLEGQDQYGIARDLTPGEGYYLAGRIIGIDVHSDVSNCIYIENPCPANPDFDCSGLVDLADFNFLAQYWLGSGP